MSEPIQEVLVKTKYDYLHLDYEWKGLWDIIMETKSQFLDVNSLEEIRLLAKKIQKKKQAEDILGLKLQKH